MTPKMLQQFDLAQSPFCQYLFAEDIRDLLDRYPFASLIIGSSAISYQSDGYTDTGERRERGKRQVKIRAQRTKQSHKLLAQAPW